MTTRRGVVYHPRVATPLETIQLDSWWAHRKTRRTSNISSNTSDLFSPEELLDVVLPSEPGVDLFNARTLNLRIITSRQTSWNSQINCWLSRAPEVNKCFFNKNVHSVIFFQEPEKSPTGQRTVHTWSWILIEAMKPSAFISSSGLVVVFIQHWPRVSYVKNFQLLLRKLVAQGDNVPHSNSSQIQNSKILY